MNEVPDDRCGYTWPEDFDPQRYSYYSQNSCCRVQLSDTNRCAWHADPDDTEEKTLEALERSRVPEEIREEKRKNSESIDGAVLKCIDLRDLSSLSGVLLRESNFTNTELVGSKLSNANLRDADLTNADLRESDLTDAYLRDADLTDADLRESDLTDAYLRDADLTDADLRESDLTDADLQGTNLLNADINNSSLPEANLLNADLTDANLREADLTNTNLQDSALDDANLYDTDLKDAFLTGASLINAYLREADITSAYFREADLTQAHLWKANLKDADLRKVELKNADLRDTDLTDADLRKVDFSNANLRDTDLTDADLHDTNLVDANLNRADLTNANLWGSELSEANVVGADLTGADLRGANFTDADLSSARLVDSAASQADFTGSNLNGASVSGIEIDPSTDIREIYASDLPDRQPTDNENHGVLLAVNTAVHYLKPSRWRNNDVTNPEQAKLIHRKIRSRLEELDLPSDIPYHYIRSKQARRREAIKDREYRTWFTMAMSRWTTMYGERPLEAFAREYPEEFDNPPTRMEPMLCQHCERAPCETVCPVSATTHSEDGLNQMTYNRCVGTRYCSNNCPFKVRRFNWYNYSRDRGDGIMARISPELEEHGRLNAEEPLPMGLNPDVTVRSRGVMEKCTFCVQRIRRAKWQMQEEGREEYLEDDVVTACEQACPADAINFGNIGKGSDHQVRKDHDSERAVSPLAQLNVESSIAYLTDIRNTEMKPSERAGHGGGHGSGGHGGEGHGDGHGQNGHGGGESGHGNDSQGGGESSHGGNEHGEQH